MMITTTGAHVKKLILVMVAIVGLAVLPTVGEAVPISGDVSLSGGVRVDATTIDWLPYTPGNTNEFAVVFSTPGDYFDFLIGTQGDAIDLNAVANPVGVPFTLPNFLTFDADAGLHFDLDYIAPCNPADCFIPGTAFNAYQQVVGGIVRTTIELAMRGTMDDSTPNAGPGPDVTNFWIGTWSADFIGQTMAQVQADFLRQGFIEAPYSSRMTVAFVPEPMTLLTFGTGTMLLAAHRRRKAKKNLA